MVLDHLKRKLKPYYKLNLSQLVGNDDNLLEGKLLVQHLEGPDVAAKAIIARLNESAPDLIVIELGDGILGGYSVESIFEDAEFREAMTVLVFCASDYVGAWGGIELFRRRGIEVHVVAGSVTDSQMGEDYIQDEFGIRAANARRNGVKLFEVVNSRIQTSVARVNT